MNFLVDSVVDHELAVDFFRMTVPLEHPVVSLTTSLKINMLPESLLLIRPVACEEPAEVIQFLISTDRVHDLRLCRSFDLVHSLLTKCSNHMLNMLMKSIRANEGYLAFKEKWLKHVFPRSVLACRQH